MSVTLKPARYELSVVATDATGTRSNVVTKRFRVRG